MAAAWLVHREDGNGSIRNGGAAKESSGKGGDTAGEVLGKYDFAWWFGEYGKVERIGVAPRFLMRFLVLVDEGWLMVVVDDFLRIRLAEREFDVGYVFLGCWRFRPDQVSHWAKRSKKQRKSGVGPVQKTWAQGRKKWMKSGVRPCDSLGRMKGK
ncbi:hypothetical protein Drorol1_Dr00003702 [Drosera rotundifolia]